MDPKTNSQRTTGTTPSSNTLQPHQFKLSQEATKILSDFVSPDALMKCQTPASVIDLMIPAIIKMFTNEQDFEKRSKWHSAKHNAQIEHLLDIMTMQYQEDLERLDPEKNIPYKNREKILLSFVFALYKQKKSIYIEQKIFDLFLSFITQHETNGPMAALLYYGLANIYPLEAKCGDYDAILTAIKRDPKNMHYVERCLAMVYHSRTLPVQPIESQTMRVALLDTARQAQIKDEAIFEFLKISADKYPDTLLDGENSILATGYAGTNPAMALSYAKKISLPKINNDLKTLPYDIFESACNHNDFPTALGCLNLMSKTEMPLGTKYSRQLNFIKKVLNCKDRKFATNDILKGVNNIVDELLVYFTNNTESGLIEDLFDILLKFDHFRKHDVWKKIPENLVVKHGTNAFIQRYATKNNHAYRYLMRKQRLHLMSLDRKQLEQLKESGEEYNIDIILKILRSQDVRKTIHSIVPTTINPILNEYVLSAAIVMSDNPDELGKMASLIKLLTSGAHYQYAQCETLEQLFASPAAKALLETALEKNFEYKIAGQCTIKHLLEIWCEHLLRICGNKKACEDVFVKYLDEIGINNKKKRQQFIEMLQQFLGQAKGNKILDDDKISTVTKISTKTRFTNISVGEINDVVHALPGKQAEKPGKLLGKQAEKPGKLLGKEPKQPPKANDEYDLEERMKEFEDIDVKLEKDEQQTEFDEYSQNMKRYLEGMRRHVQENGGMLPEEIQAQWGIKVIDLAVEVIQEIASLGGDDSEAGLKERAEIKLYEIMRSIPKGHELMLLLPMPTWKSESGHYITLRSDGDGKYTIYNPLNKNDALQPLYNSITNLLADLDPNVSFEFGPQGGFNAANECALFCVQRIEESKRKKLQENKRGRSFTRQNETAVISTRNHEEEKEVERIKTSGVGSMTVVGTLPGGFKIIEKRPGQRSKCSREVSVVNERGERMASVEERHVDHMKKVVGRLKQSVKSRKYLPSNESRYPKEKQTVNPKLSAPKTNTKQTDASIYKNTYETTSKGARNPYKDHLEGNKDASQTTGQTNLQQPAVVTQKPSAMPGSNNTARRR